MSSNDYNPVHWKKRLPTYLKEDWSRSPSPFAQTAIKYFKKEAKILELGAGAGQDGLWFEAQGHTVVLTDADDSVFSEIKKRSTKNTDPLLLNITREFPFEDGSFNVVYAELVIHYFDDETMHKIIGEIKRILKPGGVLACMVNSTSDPEYDKSLEDESGLINVDGLTKRYFTVESFKPFVQDFSPLLFDNNGRHPKDDAKGNAGMIRFIGSLQ